MNVIAAIPPRIAVVAASIFLCGAGTARGAEDPDAVLRRGVEEVLAVVYDPAPSDEPLSVRVKPVLEKYFDFGGITRRAIGPAWRQLTTDQQKEATELFGEIVLRTYADRFEPQEKPTISYGKTVELTPKRREVAQTIGYMGSNYSVAYRLELQPGGEWRVYDVIIEGVSMVSNYRAQFDAILQKGGGEALLKSLEDNLRSVTART